MDLTKVCRDIDIDYGHRVPEHKSQCRNWHGHRGKVEAEVTGPIVCQEGVSDNGMVLDFGDLKRALTEEIHAHFDHGFLLYRKDQLTAFVKPEDYLGRPKDYWFEVPDIGKIEVIHPKEFGKTVLLPCVPTAENLAKVCFKLLTKRLNKENVIWVSQVRFWETEHCYATYPANPL